MVLKRTKIKIADNSGALVVRCVRVHRTAKNTPGKVGDFIQAAICKHLPNKKVKRKGLYTVLLVNAARKFRRRDGSYTRFEENRGVIVSRSLDPIGTRVMTPIAKELKRRSMVKLISLARGSC